MITKSHDTPRPGCLAIAISVAELVSAYPSSSGVYGSVRLPSLGALIHYCTDGVVLPPDWIRVWSKVSSRGLLPERMVSSQRRLIYFQSAQKIC